MTSRTFTSTRLRASVAAVIAAAVLALTACNSGGNPPGGQSTPASTSPSATPSATPTPTALYKPADAKGKAQNVPVPVKPPLADENSKEGLEAFAKYWYSTFSYAFETGDTAPIRELTEATCSTCNKQMGVLSDWYKSGGWIEGAIFDVDVAQSTFQRASAGDYQVVTQLRQLKGTFYSAEGAVGNSQETTDYFGDIMIASFSAGKWSARTVERVGG